MRVNIGIIGHFGGKQVFTDGQTVKTTTLERALCEYDPARLKIRRVDTYYVRHNPALFLAQLLWCMITCKRVIISLSSNGRRVFFPMMYYASRFLGKQVYHCAIGGRLADEVASKKKWKKYVCGFRRNWVESHWLADRLQSMGVKNAAYLPNFKRLPVLTADQLCYQVEPPFRFCIFSRVMEEKGIGDAAGAVMELNREAGKTAAVLDIYGPIHPGYEEKLEKLLADSQGTVRYCGVIAPEKSVEALLRYNMLLFPTHWRREGIPGTIIDALSAGVPVIARRWRYCDEMLEHGKTGYCYDFDHPEELKIWMAEAIANPENVLRMKKHCLDAAAAYRADTVIPGVVRELLEE